MLRWRAIANIGDDRKLCSYARAHWNTLSHCHTGTNLLTQWHTLGKQASIDGPTHLLIPSTIAGTGHDNKARLSRLAIRTFRKYLQCRSCTVDIHI